MIFSYLLNMQSHPSWVCGLKQLAVTKADGAADVTPFVGVWIETRSSYTTYSEEGSHPSWVCGLKLIVHLNKLISCQVTPFVGVWIETTWAVMLSKPSDSHTLRGCVD